MDTCRIVVRHGALPLRAVGYPQSEMAKLGDMSTQLEFGRLTELITETATKRGVIYTQISNTNTIFNRNKTETKKCTTGIM